MDFTCLEYLEILKSGKPNLDSKMNGQIVQLLSSSMGYRSTPDRKNYGGWLTMLMCSSE